MTVPARFLLLLVCLIIPSCSNGLSELQSGQPGSGIIPLKDAKLNIEHNATDGDTGFQGFIDSEGWQELVFTGPQGNLLTLTAQGELGKLGLTELFFETVEPANREIPLEDLLKTLPEGDYNISGPAVEAGEAKGQARGTAWLTHTIPAGPVLLSPAENEVVSAVENLKVSWEPVTQTINGGEVLIIAYQLIIEKDVPPHPHMIGKYGLSMYLPSSVTSIMIPSEFFEPATSYKWEVLAIEESGNQTLSSSQFSTD